jgi:hypothetical protein
MLEENSAASKIQVAVYPVLVLVLAMLAGERPRRGPRPPRPEELGAVPAAPSPVSRQPGSVAAKVCDLAIHGQRHGTAAATVA